MPLPPVQVLDSFKRPPENPLNNGGKWAESSAFFEATDRGKIAEEKFVGISPTSISTAYWTPQEFTENVVTASIYGVESALNGTVRLNCCMPNPTGEEKGYTLLLTNEGLSAGQCKFALNQSGLAELERITVSGMKEGDGVALGVKSGKVSAWHKSGAETWTLLYEVANSVYTKGFVGLECFKSTNGAWTNFSVTKELETFSASLPFIGKMTPREEGGKSNILGMILS
jgi:hypothetical protein